MMDRFTHVQSARQIVGRMAITVTSTRPYISGFICRPTVWMDVGDAIGPNVFSFRGVS